MDLSGNMHESYLDPVISNQLLDYTIVDNYIYMTSIVRTYIVGGPSNDSLYIVKLDMALNPIVQRTLSFKHSDMNRDFEHVQLKALSDGNIMALYNFSSPPVGEEGAIPSSMNLFVTYDAALDMVDSHANESFYHTICFLPVKADNSLLTAGYESSNRYLGESLVTTSLAAIAKYDDTRVRTWLQSYNPFPTHRFSHLTQILPVNGREDNYVSIGTTSNHAPYGEHAYFVRYSEDGTIITDSKYGLASPGISSYFADIVTAADGSFLVVGAVAIEEEDAVITKQLVNLSGDGSENWSRYVSHSVHSIDPRINSILRLPDNRSVLAGAVHELNTIGAYQTQAWLLITDSLGCINDSCHYPMSMDEPNFALNGISVYPNPVTSHATIDVSQMVDSKPMEWRLIDVYGRSLQAGSIPANVQNVQIDMTAIPAGHYFLRIQAATAHATFKIGKS